MSTKGFEDKGSYPYDNPIPGKVIPFRYGGYVTERFREAQRREMMVGLVVAAVMLTIGFAFGFAAGVLYG